MSKNPISLTVLSRDPGKSYLVFPRYNHLFCFNLLYTGTPQTGTLTNNAAFKICAVHCLLRQVCYKKGFHFCDNPMSWSERKFT